jgi:very-short-patch-repair endonuclease
MAKRYPQWRKHLDNIKDRFFPEPSEQAFIRAVGKWWLYRNGFEHQVLVGPYRPDFVSRRKHQIVEIEGASKYEKRNKWGGYDVVASTEYREKQKRKWAYLQRMGWQILLVPAKQALYEPRVCRRTVRSWSKNPAKFGR